MQEKLLPIYLKEIPDFLLPFLEAKELLRLKDVGMNCGVEYSSLPFFSSLPKSSRYSHSLGVALLSYRYSNDKRAAIAGLFHDIATPCFAHTIDFLRGDHKNQTKTEEGTSSIIAGSEVIVDALRKEDIALEGIVDYSCYPVCDNPSPKLSADRLEYTLRNIYLFGYANLEKIDAFCRDLALLTNESGELELQFLNAETAKEFASLAFKTFEIYICKEDRFAMETLSKSLKELLLKGLIEESDFNSEETSLIGKIKETEVGLKVWERYTKLKRVDISSDGEPVVSKVRYIDPLVANKGRLSSIDPIYKEKIDGLKATDFSLPLIGVYH